MSTRHQSEDHTTRYTPFVDTTDGHTISAANDSSQTYQVGYTNPAVIQMSNLAYDTTAGRMVILGDLPDANRRITSTDGKLHISSGPHYDTVLREMLDIMSNMQKDIDRLKKLAEGYEYDEESEKWIASTP